MNSNYSIKSKVAELSELPKDVILGVTSLALTGNTELNIESHKGIIEYKDSIIKIRTKYGKIIIRGHQLCVTSYSNDEMIIKGFINSIELKNQEEFHCSHQNGDT